MEEGPPIDWEIFTWAAFSDQLMEYLSKLPSKRWTEILPSSNQTLLHIACTGSNIDAVVALLKSGCIDINAVDSLGWSPVFYTIPHEQPRLLEILCAAGADLQTAHFLDGRTPIEAAVRVPKNVLTRVLIANGCRLNTVREEFQSWIDSTLRVFECGVLRCRLGVVALLRVKKAGNLVLWDKFLLREIAFQVWATRCDTKW